MNNSNFSDVLITKVIKSPIIPFDVFFAVSLTLLGLIGAFGSFIVILVVSLNKTLHTSCFKLIAIASCGSFLSAIYFILRGINQLGIMTGIFQLERTSWICILPAALFGLTGPPFQCLINCAIACDRMISILAPIRYRQINKRYVTVTVIFCTVYVLTEDAIGLAVSPMLKPAACKEFTDAMNQTFKLVFAGLVLAYFVLTVLLYLPVLACFHFRLALFSQNGNDNFFRKQQMSVMPAVNLMMVLYLVTGVLGESMINVARNMSTLPSAPTLKAVGGLLKAIGCFVEALSLVIMSRSFRNSCKRLLRRNYAPGTVTVTPISAFHG